MGFVKGRQDSAQLLQCGVDGFFVLEKFVVVNMEFCKRFRIKTLQEQNPNAIDSCSP